MPITNTSNMNLPVPVVSSEAGPQYAIDINSCMSLIDSHNHTAGFGVLLTQASLNLTGDLPFNSMNATGLRSVRFTSQGSPLSVGTDLGCLYEVTNDLYYNDGLGNQIRLTQSGAVAGTSGSIANLVAPATASYNASSKTFIWQQNTNQAAIMDMATAILRPTAASASGISLTPPVGLASSYAITFPTALPASQKIVTLDNSGNLTAPYTVDGSTITIAANVIGVPTAGITATQIANGTVGTTQIATGGVATANIADAAVTQGKRVALGQQVSSSCGVFTTTNTSLTDVTNLSVTITTTGRAVMIMMIPDGSASGVNSAFIGVNATGSTSTIAGCIAVLRDGTELQSHEVGFTGSAASSSWQVLGHGSIVFLDTGASAASHTYKIQAFARAGLSSRMNINNMKLAVYEL